MPHFRVLPGGSIGHAGEVHGPGSVLELPRHVAEDMALSGLLEEVDATGEKVLAPVSDIARSVERFQAHEQVTLLQAALQDATARVEEIRVLLRAAEQRAGAHAPTDDLTEEN